MGISARNDVMQFMHHCFVVGIIHLVRMQNFPKNCYFLPLDMHAYVYILGGKKRLESGTLFSKNCFFSLLGMLSDNLNRSGNIGRYL